MVMQADEARRLLVRCGYETGEVEPGGSWGWLAFTACAAFQKRVGLPVTGDLDPRTAAALRRLSGRRRQRGGARLAGDIAPLAPRAARA